MCNLSFVLLLLGGEISHDVTAACPLTKFMELHLRVESKICNKGPDANSELAAVDDVTPVCS